MILLLWLAGIVVIVFLAPDVRGAYALKHDPISVTPVEPILARRGGLRRRHIG